MILAASQKRCNHETPIALYIITGVTPKQRKDKNKTEKG